MKYQLAQLNIARMLAPLEDPIMAGFVARLEEINQLADSSPGFIWRLQDTEGDATSLRPFEEDMLIINMSVWQDLDSLKAFTYQTIHTEVMRQRKQWFEHFGKPYMVLWWIPSGEYPTVEDAIQKLEAIQNEGSTPEAFDFRTPFPAPKS